MTKRVTLRRKLGAAFAGLVAVALLAAGAAVFTTLRWQATAADMETHYQRSLLLQRVRAGTFQALKEVDDALTADDVDARADFDRALAPATRDFAEWAALADTPAERGEVLRIREAHRRLIENARRVLALVPQDRAAAIRLVDDELDTGDYENFRQITERAVTADRGRRQQVRGDTVRLRETTQVMAAIAVLSIVSLALLIAAYLSQDLFTPLLNIARTADRLLSGDFKARADDSRDDEIGEIARALNALVANSIPQSSGQPSDSEGRRIRLHGLVAELRDRVASFPRQPGIESDGLAAEIDRLSDAISRLAQADHPLDLDLEPIDLAALIHGLLSRFSVEFADRAIGVEVIVAEDLEPILADRLKLREAICAALRNALEALPQKGGSIGLRTRADGSVVRIEIADSGRGLDQDLIEQALAGSMGKTAGSLEVAKAVIARHGGELKLFSRDGAGTVAQFTLPRRR